jgi:hypothetical protein
MEEYQNRSVHKHIPADAPSLISHMRALPQRLVSTAGSYLSCKGALWPHECFD